jgi:hypothetical protein
MNPHLLAAILGQLPQAIALLDQMITMISTEGGSGSTITIAQAQVQAAQVEKLQSMASAALTAAMASQSVPVSSSSNLVTGPTTAP